MWSTGFTYSLQLQTPNKVTAQVLTISDTALTWNSLIVELYDDTEYLGYMAIWIIRSKKYVILANSEG